MELTAGILLALVAVFLGGAAQALTGMGLGLVSGAVLVVVLGREDAVPLLGLMAVPMMLVVLWIERHHVRWRDALVMSLPAVAVTPVSALLLRLLDADALAVGSGVAVTAAVALLWSGRRVRSLRGRAGAVGAGLAAGLMNAAAGVGSPPAALYAVNSGWSASQSRATMQVFFLAMTAAALVTFGVPQRSSILLASVVVAAVGGAGIGLVLARRVPDSVSRAVTLALAGGGGVLLVLSPLLVLST